MKRSKAAVLIGTGVLAGLLLLHVRRGAAQTSESYSVPAAAAVACPDVGSGTPCVADADGTWEGAGVSTLVASAHATAWDRNGSARALGLDHTYAKSEGWILARLSAPPGLPDELRAEGGKVTVRVIGAALSTLAVPPYVRNVHGTWELEIGPPDRTGVWSDGSNYGGASTGGNPLLLVGGSSFSRVDRYGAVVSGEGSWILNCLDAPDPSCLQRQDGPGGSGLASFDRSITIRMPIDETFLVWWRATSLGDAMAVVDPVLTVHPDTPYVTLEVDGIAPPTPAPGPLDGVDIDALAARGYNVELLGALGLLEPPDPDPGNRAPTDLALTPSTVAESQAPGAVVGTFTTTDADPGDIFAYALVPGDGGADNASFVVSGDQLLTAAVFDYEARNGYSIRVRSTDGGGLSVEKALTVSVSDVPEFAIRGVVRRVTGTPLARVRISLHFPDGSFLTKRTDRKGRYCFTALPDGQEYVVRPTRSGWRFRPKWRTVLLSGADMVAGFKARSSALGGTAIPSQTPDR